MTKSNIDVLQFERDNSSTVTTSRVPFPKGKDTGRPMSIDTFLHTASFPANREVEERARKIVSLLANSKLPQHAEVDILHYTGPTVSRPAVFETGCKYVANANTRKHIWQSMSHGIAIDKKVLHLEIPEEVYAREYETDDPYEAIQWYNAFDSQDSYETPKERVTCALRAQEMLPKLTNKKVRTGAIKTALSVACPFEKAQYTVPGVHDIFDQVEKVKETITQIDKMGLPGKGACSTQLVLGVTMLAAENLGATNPSWINAAKRLATRDNSITNDGIFWIIKACETNVMGQEMANALPFSMGLFNGRNDALNFISYCWSQYINDVKMTQAPEYDEIRNQYVDLIRSTYEDND